MKLLVANWKENPLAASEAVALAKATDAASVVICPPYLFIAAISKVLKVAALGAQDGFYEPAGKFTGQVSMAQLAGAGVKYVIIGHSSRRELGEDDTVIAKKVAAALDDKLVPIICVGETRAERAAGKTQEVIDRQIRAAFSLLPVGPSEGSRDVLITYEPVWAISANQTPGMAVADTPEEAQTIVRHLQGVVRGLPVAPKFLYGGSVDEKNLAGFLACSEFSGALVGAASLRGAEFKKMIALAGKA